MVRIRNQRLGHRGKRWPLRNRQRLSIRRRELDTPLAGCRHWQLAFRAEFLRPPPSWGNRCGAASVPGQADHAAGRGQPGCRHLRLTKCDQFGKTGKPFAVHTSRSDSVPGATGAANLQSSLRAPRRADQSLVQIVERLRRKSAFNLISILLLRFAIRLSDLPAVGARSVALLRTRPVRLAVYSASALASHRAASGFQSRPDQAAPFQGASRRRSVTVIAVREIAIWVIARIENTESA